MGLSWAADGCREHAEGSLLWDVFYAPDMGAHPVAQMCMESAARQTTFNLQLASQLDQEEHLTITTLEFRFRYQARRRCPVCWLCFASADLATSPVEVVNSILHITSCTTGELWLTCGLPFAYPAAVVCSRF